jgi:hypothetical protein
MAKRGYTFGDVVRALHVLHSSIATLEAMQAERSVDSDAARTRARQIGVLTDLRDRIEQGDTEALSEALNSGFAGVRLETVRAKKAPPATVRSGRIGYKHR